MKKIIVLFILLHLTACYDIKKKNSRITDTGNKGKQGFQLLIHDAKPEGDISEINITVLEVKLVPESGEIITISNEVRSFNLIQLTEENPLELANTVIPSGRYKQLRLVLSENNTIKIDGGTHPLKTPSGQQSGVKLDGFFEITEGQFYTMTLDFKPDESIVYTNGTGYILKPVINISGTTLVSGPFSASGLIQDENVVIELKPDGTTRIISTYDPRLEIHGRYYFNYSNKILTLATTGILCSTCGDLLFSKNNFTNIFNINLNIIEWTETSISGLLNQIENNITIQVPVSFQKIPAFELNTSTGYTVLRVKASYPDNSYNNKYGVITLLPEQGRSFIDIQKISNLEAIFEFKINYKYLPGGIPGGMNSYRAKLLVADYIENLYINSIINANICGISKLSNIDYNIKVYVSDKVTTVITQFDPYDL